MALSLFIFLSVQLSLSYQYTNDDSSQKIINFLRKLYPEINSDRISAVPQTDSAFNRAVPLWDLNAQTTTFAPIVNPIPSSVPSWNSGPLRPIGPVTSPNFPGPQVQILISGHLIKLANGQLYQRSTVALVQDDNKNILVDTGMGTDAFKLVEALNQYGLTPENVDMVVITHGHLDHTGNQNFFAHKVVLFDYLEFLENRFQETTLKKAPYRKLTANTELWKTPGHTMNDITLIVKNYQGNGTLAIIGDLILNEEFLRGSLIGDIEPSWHPSLQSDNANTVVCNSDFIVPGHGPQFWVRPEYRQKANCDAKTAMKFSLPPYRNDSD